MAELADAQDLKSCGTNLPYRFDSGRRHEKALHMCAVLFLVVSHGHKLTGENPEHALIVGRAERLPTLDNGAISKKY